MSEEKQSIPPPALDLSDLKLMPAWVASFGKEEARPKYAEERDDDRRGDDRRGGAGRGFANDRGGDRRGGGGGAGGPPRGRPAFGGGGGGTGAPRPQGDRPRTGGDRDRRGGGRFDDRRGPPVDDRPQIPSGVKATIEAEDKALDALAGHIKTQGRAFSLFDAARLVLAGEDRHRVRFECEGERLVGLFSVPSCHALFETREEAVKYILRTPEAISQYYKEEQVDIDPPKGNFTSVAVCGFSGEVLGPPSHHSYQMLIKRIHFERFSNMSFEDYRRRVHVESSPELVEKWKESQSKGIRWTYLKGEPAAAPQAPEAPPPPPPAEEGAEPAPAPEAAEDPEAVAAPEPATGETFNSRADMEAHFRRMHGDEVVIEVREAVLPGTIRREQVSPGLGRLFRRNLEEARKHLFELSQKIAHGLERRGMKLFKRRAGKMFVSRVKPKAIDPGVIFSGRINAIVEAVRGEPGILASKLIEKIAPSPAVEGAAEAEPAVKQFTDEQVALLRDLRWLSDEGYVIEYSDGPVFLGVQGETSQQAEPRGRDKAPQASVAAAPIPAARGSSQAAKQVASEEAAATAPAAQAPARKAAPGEEAAPKEAAKPRAQEAQTQPVPVTDQPAEAAATQILGEDLAAEATDKDAAADHTAPANEEALVEDSADTPVPVVAGPSESATEALNEMHPASLPAMESDTATSAEALVEDSADAPVPVVAGPSEAATQILTEAALPVESPHPSVHPGREEAGHVPEADSDAEASALSDQDAKENLGVPDHLDEPANAPAQAPEEENAAAKLEKPEETAALHGV